MTLRLAYLAVLSVQLLVIASQRSCDNAEVYFSNIIDSSLLLSRPRPNQEKVCDHSETCCSQAAVSTLKDMTERDTKNVIQVVVDASKEECSEDYNEAVLTFMEKEKTILRDLIQRYLGEETQLSDALFQPFVEMIDSLGVYLKGERELCGISDLIQDLTVKYMWELFLPDTSVSSETFRTCTRNFILRTFENEISTTRFAIEKILLRVYHVIRYKTLLFKAVDSLMQEPWAAECKSALMRLRYCDGCSGLHSNASQRTLCYSECSQVNSMCLKGYKALENITESWISMSDSIKYEFLGFNPDNLLRELVNIFAVNDAQTHQNELNEECPNSIRKRNINRRVQRKSLQRSYRQSQDSFKLHPHLLSQIDCATELAKGVRISNLLSKICENATSTSGCSPDNSYEEHPIFTAKFQKIIEELEEERKYVLRILFVCETYYPPSECPQLEVGPCPSTPSPPPCYKGNVGSDALLDQDLDDEYSGLGPPCRETSTRVPILSSDIPHLSPRPYVPTSSSDVAITGDNSALVASFSSCFMLITFLLSLLLGLN